MFLFSHPYKGLQKKFESFLKHLNSSRNVFNRDEKIKHETYEKNWLHKKGINTNPEVFLGNKKQHLLNVTELFLQKNGQNKNS